MAHNSNLLDIPINPKHRTSYPPHKTRNKLICFPHLPATPHKNETQPELLKALGLQIIEENSSLFDITIYTDGSQLETGLSGSGIAIYKDKILEKISLSHPRHLSVYKSELSAIDKALKDININSPSKIIIYSDSRAPIYTLQSCFFSQEPLLKSIANSVNRLPANSSVTVQWLPAHVGIPGNELADSLAKAGALGLPKARESTTQLDERGLLRTIKTQCLQEWKSDAAHDWYRAGGTSTGSVLPREQQSLISRLKSGHLRTMTFQNGCKECLIKAAEIVCPGNVKTFQAISLSRNTVVERVTDMARNLNDQIKEKSSCFEAFSIACDESTDIGGVAQLAVFFRACDMDFNIFEELLELVPMHGTTTGEDIVVCQQATDRKYTCLVSETTMPTTAPTRTTFRDRTPNPALERALVTIAHQDHALPPSNKLRFTSPLQPHHMVESSVGPAPQAANISIGYGGTPCFNPEEEDIEDYVEEFKTWLTASKVPKGVWTKALVRWLPLDGREFIKCRFEPSAALEDVLEALKLCYPRNDGRARSRGNELKKMRRPQSTEAMGKYLMNLITAHATAGEFSPFDSNKEALWALAPKDCLLLAASWSTTRNPEEADFLQATKFLDEADKWNKGRKEAGTTSSSETTTRTAEGWEQKRGQNPRTEMPTEKARRFMLPDGTPRCFTCFQTGHKHWDCPKRRPRGEYNFTSNPVVEVSNSVESVPRVFSEVTCNTNHIIFKVKGQPGVNKRQTVNKVPLEKSTLEIGGTTMEKFRWTEIKSKAEDCEFENIKDSLIRDRIVLGCRDTTLREKYLQNPDLTLSLAINQGQAAEASQKQLRNIEKDSIDAIRKNLNEKYKPTTSLKNSYTSNPVRANFNKSIRCSKCNMAHDFGKCPAYGKECYKCRRTNHFSNCCKNRAVRCIQEIEEEKDNLLIIDSIMVVQVLRKPWKELIYIQGHPVDIKLDTGADVNILPERLIKEWPNMPLLETADCKIYTYTGQQIPVVGKCQLDCKMKYACRKVTFLIVNNSAVPILGLDECEKLNLVKRVETISDISVTLTGLLDEYKDVFKGNGHLSYMYDIKISDKAEPKISPARRLPRALLQPVKEELFKMEEVGIIEKIEEPTVWAHLMVVVKKPSGKYRICIDPRELNKWVLREHYTLPAPENILAEIPKAKFYSVLDAKSAFWQVPPSENTSKYLVMSTPFGRYRFLRLPFGISSAPEIFQKIMHKIFCDIPNMVCYIDDLLIWGNSIEDHDSTLKKVLDLAKESRLKLTLNKLQMATGVVKFLGHTISQEGILPDQDKVRAIQNMQIPKNKQELQRILGITSQFVPSMINNEAIQKQLVDNQVKMKNYYDRHTRPADPLSIKDRVWFRKDKRWIPGQLKNQANEPRSFYVKDQEGNEYRRNSIHIREDKRNETTHTDWEKPLELNQEQADLQDLEESPSQPTSSGQLSSPGSPENVTTTGPPESCTNGYPGNLITTRSGRPHHMVESSVGPAPQATNINIGYGETPCFNPEEEDIEDYVEEFKTWLTASKVPKGDWTKALVRRLPLDGREFIKCRFDPSAALEDVLEALKLRYPRNDGRACSRGSELKKMRRPQSTEDTGKYLMNLITAHATAGEFSPFNSSKEALWALAPKDCLLLAASWSTTRNPEEADLLQAAKFLDETNKWSKERTEASTTTSVEKTTRTTEGWERNPRTETPMEKARRFMLPDGTPRCFTCYQTGHKHWDCPKRRPRAGEIANVSFLSEQVGYSTTATCEYEPQKFDINPELSDSEKIDVLDVLYRYRELFSEEWNKAADIEPYHIKLKANTEPIRQKAYRRSPKEREIIEEQVKEMCEKGVIRKSTSPWASPVVLVKKSDGSYRFCVDYRKVNNVTEKFSYPLPDITDCLDRLAGMKYFSHTDFVSGYWQCPLDETSKPVTAFTTGNGLYEFQVLPFGLTGAPGHFERIMDTLLAELKWSECMVYLDDVIVYGLDIREHNVRLTNVLECFRGAGLSLKPSKCRFAYQKLPILGHVVSENGVEPATDKIEAVKEFPIPKNVKQVRSFLGLCGYYRRFIKNFSKISKPLTCLTEKDKKFVIGPAEMEAFETLKKKLTEEPILAHFNPDARIEIHTDASIVGLGAVLMQPDNDGFLHPIHYLSRTTSKHESKYGISELECLAIVWALQKLRPYIFGREFKVVTDHSALTWLANVRDPCSRLTRWGLKLMEHDFEIVHRAGRKNVAPDALSRNPFHKNDTNVEDSFNDLMACTVRIDENGQKEDTFCRDITGKLPDTKIRDEYKKINGILYKKNHATQGNQWLVVAPKQSVPEIMETAHDIPEAGHMGVAKTVHRIKQRFYWKGLEEDVRKYIRSCKVCQAFKPQRFKPAAALEPLPPATDTWERVGIDHQGPFKKSAEGYEHILTIVDHFSKYALAIPVKDTKAETTCNALLDNLFYVFGTPKCIISDQGKSFDSSTFRDFTRLYGIKHIMASVAHPQTNGLCEKLNGVIKNGIRVYLEDDHTEWPRFVKTATFAYNSSIQSSTQVTPHKLIFGVEPRTSLDVGLPTVDEPVKTYNEYVTNRILENERLKKIADENYRDRTMMTKCQYDLANRDRFRKFEVGDLVLLESSRRKPGKTEKFLR
ncbi:hypothetical protein LAZ67_7003442, partial [Cordylochernes scorpioides]